MSNKVEKETMSKRLLTGLVVPLSLGAVLAGSSIFVISQTNKNVSLEDKAKSELLGSLLLPKKEEAKTIKKENMEIAESNKKVNLGTCFVPKKELTEIDEHIAKTAWTYYENNYQEKTGLFNAANQYPSTTMWDTGSALAATIAAEDFGIIDDKEFDDKITALIKTLITMDLFKGIAPNKVYNTKTMKMVTYANKVTPDGVGVSVLDLARLVSWLRTLSCKHPKFTHQIDLALKRWNFDTLIKDGRMQSLKRYPETGEIKSFQEGRLGYEQYAAKILEREGHNLNVSSTYNNVDRKDIDIYGITVATDNRTPEEYHSNNSVVSESYIMDAIENGYDDENTPLINNIYQVQKKRWEETGIVTAVSEDNINKKPYFVYNTIFSGGKTWVAKSSKGAILTEHKTVSNKAAIAMSLLYPDDSYSDVLFNKVKSAYDPKKGWYSGIYENGEGYNSSTTANTNGVILSALLYKKYGSMHQICQKCRPSAKSKLLAANNENKNLCESN
ncbi:hypothetical protein GCM10009133_05860 [Cocleimonas flava]|uniref:Uncharacterized protein DUF3131 n=1 Tax=Cocleimonas flava TaxID=634765 RepID=A0A4V2P8T4_9GAMM|nr:DUF3131 domain-containing protein [Cocleimonas flava]TCJ86955.1 uncharacterized protein DUF3131 [Cocleimonas flava]